MGDEVLKSKIQILLFLFVIGNLYAIADDNVKKYDTLFQQIGEKRVGVSNSKIDSLKNPFDVEKKIVSVDKNVTTNKTNYILNATFDKKAKINGIWYKLNSDVIDFKLVKINSNSVIIKNEHSKKELFIRKSDVSKIKFSSK